MYTDLCGTNILKGMINPGPYIFLEYFKNFIFKSSCKLLDLSSFNLLFVCFSYFIQNVLEDYDDIVVTVASGGTASGIAIGN